MQHIKINCPKCNATIELTEKVENEIYNFFYENSSKKIKEEINESLKLKYETELQREKNNEFQKFNEQLKKVESEKNDLLNKISELEIKNQTSDERYSLILKDKENQQKNELNELVNKLEKEKNIEVQKIGNQLKELESEKNNLLNKINELEIKNNSIDEKYSLILKDKENQHKSEFNDALIKLEKEKNIELQKINEQISKIKLEKNDLLNKISELQNKNISMDEKYSLVLKDKENEFKIKLNEKINQIQNENKLKIESLAEEKNKLILLNHDNELKITNKFNEMLNENLNKEKEKYEKLINDKEAEITQIKLVNTKLTEEIARVNEIQKNELNTSKVYGISTYGGTLEEYCKDKYMEECDFEIQRYSTFEKDTKLDEENEKGDFIYRLFLDEDKKIEVTSIMFEMKRMMSNENRKNTSFLEKLDRNRKSKKCKYAVLVTTYEPENEIYNNGFKDMSGLYENMYVIRPKQIVEFIKFIVKFERDYYKLKLKEKENDDYNISLLELEKNIHQRVESILTTSGRMDNNLNKMEDEIDSAIKKLEEVKKVFNIFKNRFYSELPNKLNDLELSKIVTAKSYPLLHKKLKEEKENAKNIAEIIEEE